jgi:hypothetical protein
MGAWKKGPPSALVVCPAFRGRTEVRIPRGRIVLSSCGADPSRAQTGCLPQPTLPTCPSATAGHRARKHENEKRKAETRLAFRHAAMYQAPLRTPRPAQLLQTHAAWSAWCCLPSPPPHTHTPPPPLPTHSSVQLFSCNSTLHRRGETIRPLKSS